MKSCLLKQKFRRFRNFPFTAQQPKWQKSCSKMWPIEQLCIELGTLLYYCKYNPTNAINHVLFYLQDPALKSSLPVIDLIDAIKEGAIDYSVVKKSSGKLGSVVSSHFHYRSINSQWVEILYDWGFLAPHKGCDLHCEALELKLAVAFFGTIFTTLM